MAFSFYLISEETKGYFAISKQISATSAPKDIMTDKIPRITIMILYPLISNPPFKTKRGPTLPDYPKSIIEQTNIRYNKDHII